MEKRKSLDLAAMVSTIVAAYVSNHVIGREQLSNLIELVQRSLLSASLNTCVNVANYH